MYVDTELTAHMTSVMQYSITLKLLEATQATCQH